MSSFRIASLSLGLLSLFLCAHADILWDTCVGIADHPTVKEGNYYNLCIQDHEFENEHHSWTLTKSAVQNTDFTDCSFYHDREKIQNFTEAVWKNVNFKDCTFGSRVPDKPIIFDKTTMTNVHFDGCTFHSSVDMVFREFLFNNVSFSNCIFESDTLFTLGVINEIVFNDCQFKRSENAETVSDTDAFTMRSVTVRNMDVTDSEFINPIRMEGVTAADLSFNDSTINQFWCHGEPAPDKSIKYHSGFNGTGFYEVKFLDTFNCDQTSWLGMNFRNATFHADADFSSSNILDIYWDGVKMLALDGSCLELDFSESKIERRVFANISVECKANFEKTTFETVFVKNLSAKKPNFKDAVFIEQEYIDGECCSVACKPLKCRCDVSEPSGQCPIAYKPMNASTRAMEAPGDGCFPADATVRLDTGSVVSMEDLDVAHNIAIGAGQHSDVFFFGHKSASKMSEFVSIEHEGSTKSLKLSPNHYLYINGVMRVAGSVRKGDVLRNEDGNDSMMVTGVSRKVLPGLYAPTSMHGDLLVDGVVVSSYTNAIHPELAHMLLHPLRLLYRVGLHSVVSRFSLLHEQSWAGIPRSLGIPLGPDSIEK